MRIFKTVEVMYGDKEDRRSSGESDFGCHWKARSLQGRGLSPKFRVTWIRNTGEFYVINTQSGVVYLTEKVIPCVDETEEFMEGWAEKVCAGEGYVEDFFPEVGDPILRGQVARTWNN